MRLVLRSKMSLKGWTVGRIPLSAPSSNPFKPSQSVRFFQVGVESQESRMTSERQIYSLILLK